MLPNYGRVGRYGFTDMRTARDPTYATMLGTEEYSHCLPSEEVFSPVYLTCSLIMHQSPLPIPRCLLDSSAQFASHLPKECDVAFEPLAYPPMGSPDEFTREHSGSLAEDGFRVIVEQGVSIPNGEDHAYPRGQFVHRFRRTRVRSG